MYYTVFKDVNAVKESTLTLLKQIASGVAAQFGSNCEIVVHELDGDDRENTIVAIENGHVTSRALGDGPSHVVLQALRSDPKKLRDHLCYLTRTNDGRVLRSSTIFVRDDSGEKVVGVFAINYDITPLVMAQGVIQDFIAVPEAEEKPERIVQNVNDLLDELIEQSVALTGKPVALMGKEDKMKAIQFLNDAGAFLITKSSEKVCKYFGISKYTLYNYIEK